MLFCRPLFFSTAFDDFPLNLCAIAVSYTHLVIVRRVDTVFQRLRRSRQSCCHAKAQAKGCLLYTSLCCTSALAAGGDVAGAVEQTWTEAAKQIKSVVEKVVFPALDMILAIAFFVKLGGAYFDYRQRGQFEWTGPAILFACLIFSLIAPKYIWNIIGI